MPAELKELRKLKKDHERLKQEHDLQKKTAPKRRIPNGRGEV